MHSIPNYPNIIKHKVTVEMPKSASLYGQHLLCISLTGDEINKVAKNLAVSKMAIYYSNANS